MAWPSENWTRPAASPTETVALTLIPVNLEDDGVPTIRQDFAATLNAAERLLRRVKITPIFVGNQFQFQIDVYDFLGQATHTYAGAATGQFTDANADGRGPSQTVLSPFFDLDAFYSAAGVPRS
jgi:hypothetical protein